MNQPSNQQNLLFRRQGDYCRLDWLPQCHWRGWIVTSIKQSGPVRLRLNLPSVSDGVMKLLATLISGVWMLIPVGLPGPEAHRKPWEGKSALVRQTLWLMWLLCCSSVKLGSETRVGSAPVGVLVLCSPFFFSWLGSGSYLVWLHNTRVSDSVLIPRRALNISILMHRWGKGENDMKLILWLWYHFIPHKSTVL